MIYIYYAIFTLLISNYVNAQPTFYIQTGSNITKVDNADPDNVHPIEWRVRLYKKNTPAVGNSYWGVIKGKSASEVMGKLQSSQDFELQFNAFIRKGKVQDNVFTNFNPLGPIAIVDESEKKSPSDESSNDNVESMFEKAMDHFEVFKDVKAKMDVLIKGKAITPFDNMGKVFQEYTSNLKTAISQLLSLRNTLFASSRQSFDQINLALQNIDRKLNTADKNAQTITSKYTEAQAKKNNQKCSNCDYLFYTASFEVPGDEYYPSGARTQKRLNFVSDPIPYIKGYMERRKAFEAGIRRVFSGYTGWNDYDCSEHLNRPSSTERMSSFADCEMEIEKYKQKQYSGWGGNTKRFQIIEVNTGTLGNETGQDKPIPIRGYNEDEIDYKFKIHDLGVAYYTGKGELKNDKKAFECFTIAATTGSGWHPSMVGVGMCYLQGLGTKKNYWEALKWFTKSKGMNGSMYFLGTMYDQGLGVEQNAKIANDWYLKAAMNGNQAAASKFQTFKVEGHHVEAKDGLSSWEIYNLVLPDNQVRSMFKAWWDGINQSLKKEEEQYAIYIDKITYDVYQGINIRSFATDGSIKTIYVFKTNDSNGKRFVKFRYANSKNDIVEKCFDCSLGKNLDCNSVGNSELTFIDLTK